MQPEANQSLHAFHYPEMHLRGEAYQLKDQGHEEAAADMEAAANALKQMQAQPAPLADAVLAELEALLNKATPAPWRVVEFKEPAGNYDGAPSLGTDYLLVVDEGDEMCDVEPTEANQKLKVALRNAAPSLLARLRAAEAKLKSTTEAIPTLLHYLSLAEQEADKEEPNDGYEALYNAASHVSTRLRGLQHELAPAVKGGQLNA